jgi:hypothetical protein
VYQELGSLDRMASTIEGDGTGSNQVMLDSDVVMHNNDAVLYDARRLEEKITTS